MPVLRVKVKLHARESRLEMLPDGSCIAHLRSPPVDGKANAELIGLIAEHFRCSKSAVTIKGGAASRTKLVSIG